MNNERTIYVDPNRTGNNIFSTIKEAKNYIRTLDKSEGDIIVEIANGIYELSETVVFDERDSGTKNCTIHYVAAKGAHPVISGGRELRTEWKEEGNGIFSTEYHRDKKLRALYVNGKRCYMTEKVIEGKGPAGKYKIEAGSKDWAWTSGTEHSGVILKKGSVELNTRNPEDIELMTQSTWNTTIVCVDSLEKHGQNICARFQMPYGAIAQTLGWGNEYRFRKSNMVYNVFENLNKPGEFYFDKSAGRLYYCPRKNEDINTTCVVVPELETLFDIEGKNTSQRAQNISFEGLTFAYTDWNLFRAGESYGRATNQGAAALTAYAEKDWHEYIYRAYDVGPAAVQISSAQNIVFDGNTVLHTGNEGISVINDAVDIKITNNIIYDTAGAALLIGHPQHEYIGDRGSGFGTHSDKEKYSADKEGACKNTMVCNNFFKNTSRLFWGVAGIMVYMSDGMRFTHNHIENTPYSGISLGWGWWKMNGDKDSVVPGVPSATMKNNIMKNNCFKNTITTLNDGGAIYSIGDMPGTIISENYINTIGSDFSNHAGLIRGIHPDEGSRNIFGEKNVINIDPKYTCIDCGDWGRKRNNTWVNNYSTAESYTTIKTYEPNTIIKNAHYIPNADWDETARAVIASAGISNDLYEKIPKYILSDENEIIKAIPKHKPNIKTIAGISACAAALLAGITAAVVKKLLK